MNTLPVTVDFVFSKRIPKILESLMIREYMRMRTHAVDALNPNYEKWNAEFGDIELREDDELADFGGKEYCEYICEKTRDVLKQVNRKYHSWIIELDVSKVGDIIARSKSGNVTMECLVNIIEP